MRLFAKQRKIRIHDVDVMEDVVSILNKKGYYANGYTTDEEETPYIEFANRLPDEVKTAIPDSWKLIPSPVTEDCDLLYIPFKSFIFRKKLISYRINGVNKILEWAISIPEKV
jgi:hypothetical protein